MSALPLRPFGVPDLVWPPGMCEACYEPQWSDALRDWEYVEDGVGLCGACQALQTDVARSLDRKDIRARLADQAGYDALFHSVARGDGERESSR